ncbi:glycosyltransferase [Microbacterium sp. Au-Mic1]|uniref:glycosyltransferase n=1 Tax=Microbacterium sp. Au-Mic1 TaxID=2906457 RepID=UPI001E531CFD|nr:glycosyltransferase [Microbacterium sp. Au-Mic1]MCE4027295.1 glycosyltransferase [Microbacterium sp. Au-Mic1]
MSDLVVLSLERWDEVWRRNQHLVSGLLREDPALRVLFVEPPDDPLHALRRRARPEFGHGVRAVAERLHTIRPVKWLPRRMDPGADERIEHTITRAAARLGMTDPLLWVNDPRMAGLARRTGWRALYDLTDDWLAADRPAAEMHRVAEGEAWLLGHAAAVVACSPELARRKSPQRPDIAVVRNGVDVDAYRTPQPRPADLPPGPVALYLGTLHRDRLDVALCVRTAAELGAGNRTGGAGDPGSAWGGPRSIGTAGSTGTTGGSTANAGTSGTVVLVGPNALDEADTARLRDAGAIVLGARRREAVIGYLQHADALLVPHVVTDFTESLDPLKLYEYRAVGRPVVSTPVAGFRDADDPLIRIATTEDFPDAVRKALAEAIDPSPTVPAPRTTGADPDPALSADWSLRVAEMQAVLAAAAGS